jgi:hypothetical protein
MKAPLLSVVFLGLWASIALAESPRFVIVTVETNWPDGLNDPVGEVEQCFDEMVADYLVKSDDGRTYKLPKTNARPIGAEEAVLALLAQRQRLYAELDAAKGRAEAQTARSAPNKYVPEPSEGARTRTPNLPGMEPTPELDTFRPAASAIMQDPYAPRTGHGKITIINGTEHCAIVKMHEWTTDRKIISFGVLAHSSYEVTDIPDNNYRVLFGLGDLMSLRTKTFSPTLSAFQFDRPVSFVTRSDEQGRIIYSTQTLTLHTVRGGKAPATAMRPEDFDTW